MDEQVHPVLQAAVIDRGPIFIVVAESDPDSACVFATKVEAVEFADTEAARTGVAQYLGNAGFVSAYDRAPSKEERL